LTPWSKPGRLISSGEIKVQHRSVVRPKLIHCDLVGRFEQTSRECEIRMCIGLGEKEKTLGSGVRNRGTAWVPETSAYFQSAAFLVTDHRPLQISRAASSRPSPSDRFNVPAATIKLLQIGVGQVCLLTTNSRLRMVSFTYLGVQLRMQPCTLFKCSSGVHLVSLELPRWRERNATWESLHDEIQNWLRSESEVSGDCRPGSE
jgi:hypothetical protein